MTTIERSGYLAHAASAGYRRKALAARNIIIRALAGARDPYISLSCGKDSSAMAYLILRIAPCTPIRIATAKETRLLHPTLDDCLNWWRSSFPSAPIMEIEYRFDGEGNDLAPLDDGPAMVPAVTRAAPFDVCFVGVRSEESRMRRFSNRHFRDDPAWPIYTYRNPHDPRHGTKRVLPLADWLTRDVWACLAEHGIPVLDQYDEGPDERTTLRLTPESISDGVVGKLRRRNEVAYRELVRQHPEIARLS